MDSTGGIYTQEGRAYISRCRRGNSERLTVALGGTSQPQPHQRLGVYLYSYLLVTRCSLGGGERHIACHIEYME